MSQIFTCYNCLKKFPILGETIHRTDACPHCDVSIRCCKMCKFYDPKCYNECRESNAERIVEKEKANFCDFYFPDNREAEASAKENAAKAFEALFKK